MKNILITGSEGFVGRNLLETLAHRSDFTLSGSRQDDLDLTDSNQVKEYIKILQPNIIIHSATSNTMGKAYESDVCEQNLRMIFNLLRHRPPGCLIYTLCSGSSYNRESWTDNMTEDYLGEHIPADSQGFSKFVIANYVKNIKDVVTLRLFGIFGRHEDYRYKFISNTIAKRLAGMKVILYRDALYDYIDVADFCTIVEQLIDRNVRTGGFNVTPDDSVYLSDIIGIVDRCLNIDSGYTTATLGLGRTYTGSNTKLRSILGEFEFTSIEASIQNLIHYYTANTQKLDYAALDKDPLLQYAKAINSR